MTSPPAAVSVVISCYNYGRFLAAAVQSALSQSEVEVDIVIVDDASSDDSVLIARALADQHPCVQLVCHTHNVGHVETYNEALGLATAEYVVKLDADDMLTAGSLARSTALMRAHPEVTFCYGYPITFSDEPPSTIPMDVRSWTVWAGRDWISRVLRRGHNVIHQPEVIMRRDAAVEADGYRAQLRWAEDYNLWLRLALKGSVGRVNGAAQGLYRVHEASLQRSVEDIELADLRARVEAVTLFFDECSGELSGIRLSRQRALGVLASDARRLAARALSRPAGGQEAAAAFLSIAQELEDENGRPAWSPSWSPGPLGRVYRDVTGRVRWRLWRRYGL